MVKKYENRELGMAGTGLVLAVPIFFILVCREKEDQHV